MGGKTRIEDWVRLRVEVELTAGGARPIAEHEAVGERDDEHDGDDEDGERDLPVEQADAGALLVLLAHFTITDKNENEPWMKQLQSLAYQEEEKRAALGEAQREQGPGERGVEWPFAHAAAGRERRARGGG